jgi:hypothetical protein
MTLVDYAIDCLRPEEFEPCDCPEPCGEPHFALDSGQGLPRELVFELLRHNGGGLAELDAAIEAINAAQPKEKRHEALPTG